MSLIQKDMDLHHSTHSRHMSGTSHDPQSLANVLMDQTIRCLFGGGPQVIMDGCSARGE